jgi:hypothetical protein
MINKKSWDQQDFLFVKHQGNDESLHLILYRAAYDDNQFFPFHKREINVCYLLLKLQTQSEGSKIMGVDLLLSHTCTK